MSFMMNSGQIFSENRLLRISGTSSLNIPRLHIDLEFTIPIHRPNIYLTGLVADFFIIQQNTPTLVGRISQSGNLEVIPSAPLSRQDSLSIVINHELIHHIETARANSDLRLELALKGIIWTPDGQISASDTISYTVAQSRWIEILRQLRYSDTLLIEVHIPADSTKDEILANAYQHLKQAQHFLLLGDWRNKVGTCLDILESLSEKIGDKDKQTGDSISFENSKKLSKLERKRVVRRALKLLSHPARHADEVAQAHSWSKEDAIFMLASCASLLNALK